MSLLKWKELAKSKSELGDKINYYILCVDISVIKP